MAGEKTREAIFAQPDWLRRVPTDRRLPAGRSIFTGCGTSYHAALTGGEALQALELVLEPKRDADVLAELARPAEPSDHVRYVIAGAGRDWPTAQEAALKLREGAFLPAEAHQTEQLLHGHLAAVDDTVRCFVLEGEGRGAERARDAVAALTELGCEVELVPTRHPAVDIVRFQLLTLALAERRGVNPDLIRTDDERWKRARAAYK
jgi:glucosamine 6-phosphate synthetase-like amidotransferase/phosphosugar isomerase protein